MGGHSFKQFPVTAQLLAWLVLSLKEYSQGSWMSTNSWPPFVLRIAFCDGPSSQSSMQHGSLVSFVLCVFSFLYFAQLVPLTLVCG